MAGSLLHELLHEARHDEALVLRDRAMLLDLDLVADLVLVGLVVRLVAGALADVLAVQGIAVRVDALDDHGLLHLRLDDAADHLATEAVGLVRRGAGLLGSFAHGYLASLFFADFAVFVGAGFFSAFSAAGAAAFASAFGAFAFGAFAGFRA